MSRRSPWLHRSVALGVVLVLTTGGALAWQGTHRSVPLYQEAVVRDAAGELVPVAPGRTAAGWAPLREPAATRPLELALLTDRQARAQRWLASGWLPDPDDPHEAMVRAALRDLHTLTGPTGTAPGAVLAGASPAWRFVWPRDASFVAAAYARTGHPDDALAVLLHLQALQGPDGSMQARYLPDGSGSVPDERLPQEDGPGWALWAARTLVEAGMESPATPAGDREIPVPAPAAGVEPAVALAPLVTRSTARLLERIDPATGLPYPSPDYWERPEDDLTLGIAATSLMGLEAAAWFADEGLVAPGDWVAAGVDPDVLAPTAQALRARIVQEFGPGYPRHVGGRADAAVTFLLPPFVEEPVQGADEARLRAQRAQVRPAGGVAPGAGWRRDGVSWTPQTALQALAAASGGHEEEARRWLDWLAEHRTEAGALPEKVLHDGSPAAVAPLGWTAALVLLAVTGPGPDRR